MRRLILGLFCFCRLALAPGGATPLDATLPAGERRSLQHEALLVIELLQGLHYADRPFRDFSAHELLDRDIESLDRDHLIFTAPDLEFMHHRFDRDLKPVYLFKGDLHPAFEVFDLFATRALARFAWIEQRLKQPFDFSTEATVAIDRRKAAWPASADAADTSWDRWLQLEVLNEMVDGRDQAAAVGEVRRRYAESRKQIEQMDPLAVRERFLDALLEIFDPHSGYFSRDSAEQFDVMMSGAVVGIGVELRSLHGRFIVETVQPGGPADRSGRINPGDEIVSVAAAGGTPVELSGRRLRELVELMGGPQGSKLTLAIRAQGAGPPMSVSLERARVEIARDHARGAVVSVPGGDRPTPVGVLTLPAFYGAPEASARSASVSADVRELLGQFSARGVEAVVIDLRDNGGGLLEEAVKLAGLFIRPGPVVLVRGLGGNVEEHRTDDPAVIFAKPLVILTSRASASASEAFAGALQCYHRAVIAGAESTFGKGTAQDFIDLHKPASGSPAPGQDSWGVARVTRQYYYLPDGNTPQQKGIASDVVLPAYFSPEPLEKDLPHALPGDVIATHVPTNATPGIAVVTDDLLSRLRAASLARIHDLPEFALQKRAIEFHRQGWTREEWSLQLDARRRERANDDQTRAALRKERQELEAQLAYPTESVDLPVVADAERIHQAALRARTLPDGSSCVNHFFWNVFYYELSPGGRIREIRVDALDFEACTLNRAPLAAAWTRATNMPLADGQVAAILADLKRRSRTPDEAPEIPAVFRKQTGTDVSDRMLAAGMDAFFKQAIELDGEVLRERPGLDVSLRESVRIAADWARLQPESPLARMFRTAADAAAKMEGAALSAPHSPEHITGANRGNGEQEQKR